MVQPIRGDSIERKLLLALLKCFATLGEGSLALLLGFLVLSQSVAATPTRMSVTIAQQPAATSQDATRAAAQRASAEAEQLRKQETAQSQQQAIQKYEEALQLWRTVGDRSQEARTLKHIGSAYYHLHDLQKALSYYNQELLLRRTLKQTDEEGQALWSIGLTYDTLGEKPKALDYYNQALSRLRSVNNRVEEARVLWSIAGVYKDLGEKPKALDYYNQSLTLSRSIGDSPNGDSFALRNQEAYTLSYMGMIYFGLGDKPKALDALNQALAIRRATKNLSGEVRVLQNIAIIYIHSGEYQKALDTFAAALPLVEGEKNRPEKATILDHIGMIYYSMGDFQKALDCYNQALSLYKILGDRLGEASTLYGLGGVYNTLSEHQKALASYDQALVLARAMENRDFEAKIFGDRAIVHRELGENKLSLSSYNQALLIYRQLGDRSQEALVLDSIASVYRDLGDNQQALNTYNQALSLERQVGDAAGEADTLRSIASVYSRLGNYPLSLDTYNQALSAYRTINNLLGEARTLSDIADVYQYSQEYDKALDFSNQALSLWRKIGDRAGQIQILTTIAKIYKSKGDPRQMLSTATQIRALGRDLGNGTFEAAGLMWMGVTYREMGDYQKSLDLLNQGRLLLQRANGWAKADARVLREIGQVYQVSKQPQKAIEFYNQELVLRRKIGDRVEEAATLYSIATVERDRGNLDEANKQAQAVINIVESLRSNVVSPELRTSYFASVQKYYQFYIDLLMQLHKQQPTKGYDSLALQASEQARARSLLEILNEANADIRQGVEPKLLEQERSLQQQLDAAEKRRIQLLSGKPTAEQTAALDKQVNALLAQYQEVQAKIRATSPRYAALTQPKPLTLAEIQQQVLDDDTLLLEYSLGETRSYLWVVTKTNITSYELPKRADIEAAAQSFYEQSGKQTLPNQRGLGVAPRADNIEATTQLSQMLLSPIAGQLGSKRLLIVSDGALQYLPFAALPAPDTIGNGNNPLPLIVKHEIVNLPSASTLAVLRQEHKGRQPAAKTLAILADPVFSQDDQRVKTSITANSPSRAKQATRSVTPNELDTQALTRAAKESGITFNRLPFTRKEAERILPLVPSEQEMQAFDFAASRALATSSQLSQYQIVHFATHGILNSKNPELSGVVLSLVDEKGTPENGFLRLHDIFNLNLPSELVVLSACETGLGQEVKGEGLIGLTRGFMYAGAPRVLVSLWSVNDEATSELMSRFYKKMLQEKLQPAAALRAAQIEMLQNSQWKDPFYWAAFTLQGEWR